MGGRGTMTDFSNKPVLVFDIETIADIEGARRVYPQLATLSDDDALTALTSLRRQESGNDFMRLPLHKIVCISVFYMKQGQLSLFSLTADTLSEKEILSTFFRAFKDVNTLPQLVSWNGSGFDIPVIIYRAMLYDLSVPLLFEEGHSINTMRYDNYVNRFHPRHLDLMDRFSQYGGSRREAMTIVANLYGLPGKRDIDGSQVGEMVTKQQWKQLAIYCESDVLNTWLIYLRWMRLTGRLSSPDFDRWQAETRQFLHNKLEEDSSIRHQDFLAHWPTTS